MAQDLTAVFAEVPDVRVVSDPEWLTALSASRDRYSANTLRRVLGIIRPFANGIDTPGSKAAHRMKMPPRTEIL